MLDSPKAIVGAAFAVDDRVTSKHATKWLAELDAAGWIRRYSCGQGKYILVERWNEIQKVPHKTESILPGPSEADSSDSGISPESLANDSGEAHAPVFVSASVPVNGSGLVSVQQSDNSSRVTTTGTSSSVAPPPPDQETDDDRPLTPDHRRQLIASVARLGGQYRVNQ